MNTYKYNTYYSRLFRGGFSSFPNVIYFNGNSSCALYQEILHNYAELHSAVKVFNANGYFPLEFDIKTHCYHSSSLSFQFVLHDGFQVTYEVDVTDETSYQDFLCILRSFIRHIPSYYFQILFSNRVAKDFSYMGEWIYYRPLDLLETLKPLLAKGEEQIREDERTHIRYNICSLSHLLDNQTIRTTGKTFSEMLNLGCISTNYLMTDIVTNTTIPLNIPSKVSNIRFKIPSDEYDNLICSLEKILKHAKSEAKKNNRDKEPLRDYVNPKLWKFPGVHNVFQSVCRAIHSDDSDKPSRVICEIIALINKDWLLYPYEKKPFLYGRKFFNYLKEYTHSNINVNTYSRMARKMMKT